MKMNNRVYGVVAIKSRMANWNADFTGRPKTISNGEIFGSDKAFKYPIKRMWVHEGEKVLYIKSYKISEKGTGEEAGKLQPADLGERYEALFGEELEKKGSAKQISSKQVLKNLFSCIDVLNFGATFAQAGHNIGITGVVQVGQGFNQYSEAMVESQDILSPFRNSQREDADASSLGTKILVDEAHYFYPFSVNPENYHDYAALLENFEGYTMEAYEKFKKGCLVAATAFNTNSKSGCENEFALFVECKTGERLYLPPLDQYVSFEKGEGSNKIILDRLAGLLSGAEDSIERIEIYYNPFTLEKPELPGLEYQIKTLF